jgi:hypothetical protein
VKVMQHPPKIRGVWVPPGVEVAVADSVPGVESGDLRTGLLSLDDRVSRPALPISTCQPGLQEHGKQATLHAFACIETVTFL